MSIEDYPYKSIFAANLTKISDNDLDTYLAKADLNQLKPLMPEGIDLVKNKDLIGCVVNVAVAGRVNANGDSVTHLAAAKIAKNFVYKYVNIGHKSNLIKGSIVNYGFSKFGTDELISEQDAISSPEPYNISVAFVLWKSSLTSDFINILEKSVDPTSNKYKCISASWELLFKEYDIAVGNKNINESELVTSKEQKDSLEKYLQANGGDGKKDNKLVYRVIKGENEFDFLIPAGIGLVENPAAEVKGLEIITASNKNENIENFTNAQKSVTNTDTNKQNNFMDKKITKIEDINDEMFKEAHASNVVREFITKTIQDENAKFILEQGKVQVAEKSLADTQKELDTVKASLKLVQDQLAAKAAQELFTQRMTHFDDTYELSSDERKLIASEIKELSEESFNSVKDKYAVLLKDKNKESIAAKKKENPFKKKDKSGEKPGDSKNDKEPDDDSDDSKAEDMEDDSTAAKDKKAEKDMKKDCKAEEDGKNSAAIEDALKSGKDANAKLPNATTPEVSYADRFTNAFSVENCVVITK